MKISFLITLLIINFIINKKQSEEDKLELKNKIENKKKEHINEIQKRLLKIIDNYAFVFKNKSSLLEEIKNIKTEKKLKFVIEKVKYVTNKYFFENEFRGIINNKIKTINDKSFDKCSKIVKSTENMINCQNGYYLFFNFLLSLRLRNHTHLNKTIIKTVKEYLDK